MDDSNPFNTGLKILKYYYIPRSPMGKTGAFFPFFRPQPQHVSPVTPFCKIFVYTKQAPLKSLPKKQKRGPTGLLKALFSQIYFIFGRL